MKQLLSFIRKEFYHVFRDRKTLLMLFGLPIAQIVLFGFALSTEVKNAKLAVIDYSKDADTKEIVDKVAASDYFDIAINLSSEKELEDVFKRGEIKAALVFPENFSGDLKHLNSAHIQVITDASDINTANTISNYLTSIISDYQLDLMKNSSVPYQIIPDQRMLYNPQLKGEYTFIPGMMAMIMMLVCVMMTAIAIVKEKEMGTMEILLVSPFKPLMVIVSKFIPYLVIALVNVTSILVLSWVFLGLGVRGSIFLLYAESLLFILTSLALGLLISIISDSQQTAMFGSLMATMLPTLLLSGFMFPVENMPVALQVVSNVVPSRWFYIIVKSIMIKGLGIADLWKETLILVGMTVFLLLLSIKKFKIRLS
ncbi:ABC transporter permease [Fulvivirga ligni]|uniref:ABC transporter permease n=1 Tax=Fulvivirga ligni TaxID=2904246 RepID=UPI001F16BC92|nr:ABC transporter permease [Fulvivirga ligni]UII21001.1 ABC transporter permease [Fulvivirga ligni]